MSQDHMQETPQSEASGNNAPDIVGNAIPTSNPAPEAPVAATEPMPLETPASGPDSDDTVGTGTSIALGCIAGTLLLIIIGLVFVGLLTLF